MIRQLNDHLLDTLWTENFICENAPELVRRDGSQAGYNQELARCDLFLALIKSDHLGMYTRQEIELAARLHGEKGQPKKLLVCLTGRDTLPTELEPLAGCLEVRTFPDSAQLKEHLLNALRELCLTYKTVTFNQKKSICTNP